MKQIRIAEPALDTFLSSFKAIPSMRKGKTMLPATFAPQAYSVILGRGKVNETVGNRRLKILVDIELSNFEKAKSRRERASVVDRVMETIQEACKMGAFIRYEDGVWYEVDDTEARDKIATMFRNKLSHQYKSSTSNKVERRRQRKAMMNQSMMSRGKPKAVSFVNMDFLRGESQYMEHSTSDCISVLSL
jgi:hypothetical protein